MPAASTLIFLATIASNRRASSTNSPAVSCSAVFSSRPDRPASSAAAGHFHRPTRPGREPDRHVPNWPCSCARPELVDRSPESCATNSASTFVRGVPAESRSAFQNIRNSFKRRLAALCRCSGMPFKASVCLIRREAIRSSLLIPERARFGRCPPACPVSPGIASAPWPPLPLPTFPIAR